MNRLVIGTTNAGKVIEIRSALGEVEGWSIEPLPPGVPDIEETGSTFLENAILKAGYYSQFVDNLTLADDSGLCVEALDGKPGVHSARYAGNPMARIRRVLQETEGIPEERRNAVFYCALALAQRGKVIWSVVSEVRGKINYEPAGAEGFGYDPIFRLPELNRTMAQLTTEEKNRLSARGKALAEFRRYLTSLAGGAQAR